MMITNNQVQSIVKEMVKLSEEIDKERKRINGSGPEDDNVYITYREGYYDASFDFILKLGYSLEDIEEMEREYRD